MRRVRLSLVLALALLALLAASTGGTVLLPAEAQGAAQVGQSLWVDIDAANIEDPGGKVHTTQLLGWEVREGNSQDLTEAAEGKQYRGVVRYVSSSQFSGDTEGAVTEDDPGSNTASGALSIADPDEGDSPTIGAQDFAGTYGALAVLDGGPGPTPWTTTTPKPTPSTAARPSPTPSPSPPPTATP